MRTPEQARRIAERDEQLEAARRQRVQRILESIPTVRKASQLTGFDEKAERQAAELARRTADGGSQKRLIAIFFND